VTIVEWGAAFAMGAMGSTHCVAMCGPLSSVLGNKRRLLLAEERKTPDWASRGAVQAGRITTYGALGVVAGVLGTEARHLPGLSSVHLATRIGAALLLVGTGLYVGGLFRRFSVLERALAPLHRAVSRLQKRAHVSGLVGRYVAGLAWGLLPCGLVLGALGLAVVSANALAGAGVMIAFGLGTLPALLAVDLFAATFQRFIRHVWLRRAGGALIAISGLVQADLAFEYARALGRASEAHCCAAHRHTNQ
jgi:sulfite exporter TauE/SafE